MVSSLACDMSTGIYVRHEYMYLHVGTREGRAMEARNPYPDTMYGQKYSYCQKVWRFQLHCHSFSIARHDSSGGSASNTKISEITRTTFGRDLTIRMSNTCDGSNSTGNLKTLRHWRGHRNASEQTGWIHALYVLALVPSHCQLAPMDQR